MYETYYGLNARPFQLRPDPHFFFGSSGHKRAMAYLEYGLSQGEGFIVVTGEVGAGKTTLVRNLFNQLPPDRIVAAHLVNTHLDPEDTLRMVAAAFGLPHEGAGKADLLTRLERFLRSIDQQGKRALLVVDEAQNLNPRTVEELRMLSNFQTDARPLLQTFLLGQPEFRATLHSPGMQQLRQRVIAGCHLGPMDAPETRAYIEHRLSTAGWKGDPGFDDSAHAAIFAYSGGIPRKINTLLDRVLLMGYLEEIHAFAKAHIDEVVRDIGQECELPDTLRAPQAPPPREGAPSGGASAMEERLTRIEETVGSILSILQKIVANQQGVAANQPVDSEK